MIEGIGEVHFANGRLWFLLLLPVALLPLHVWASLFRRKVERSFSGQTLVKAMILGKSPFKRFMFGFLVFLGLEALGVAILEPKYGLKEVTVRGMGIDIAFVVDVSKSMKVADIVPDRLGATTIEIVRLLNLMKGNRVALVPFAGLAFVQTPLTLDYEVIKEYLASLRVTEMPVPGTAIGRALKVAIRALRAEEKNPKKVIILFSDGENHEGEPEQVAEELAKMGVVVFTVGVGTPSGQPVPLLDENGKVVGTMREKDGVTPVISKLNEDLLRTIAQKTSGKYFALTQAGGVAEELLNELQAIEKAEYGSRIESMMEDRFQYPLAVAVVCFLLAFLFAGGTLKTQTALLCLVVLGYPFSVHAKGFFERQHPKVKEAISLIQGGQTGDGIKLLEEVSQEMPLRPDLYYDMALAYALASEYEKAISAIDKAIEAHHSFMEKGEAMVPMARLLFAKGTILGQWAKKMEGEKKGAREVRDKWRQALEALSIALLLAPEDKDIRRNLEIAAMAAYPPCHKLDDRFEPNNSLQDAKFLEPHPETNEVKEELFLCPKDEDFFKLPLRPGESVFARVLDPEEIDKEKPKPAEVDITLMDENGASLSGPAKSVFAKAKGSQKTMYYLVNHQGEMDDGISYVLSAQIIPPCPAGDDSFEDNDTKDGAKEIKDGTYALRVCPEDDDWFVYTEKKGERMDIVLKFQDGEGPLEMEVFSADGALLDAIYDRQKDVNLVVVSLPKAENDAIFIIRVYGGGNEGFYELAIEKGKGGGQNNQNQKQPENEQSQGSQTMRELLESIDRNEENLEAKEALRSLPKDYAPIKDW